MLAAGCCGCSPKTSRLAKFLVPSILFIGLACSIYWIMAAALELGLRSKFVVTSKSDSSYDAWTEYYASVCAPPSIPLTHMHARSARCPAGVVWAHPNRGVRGPW